MYVAYLKAKILLHLAEKAQITLLLAKKVIVPEKYLDFLNVFSKKLIVELFEYFNINKYAINLESYKKPPYRLIYSLGLVELETLKTYIETNLINSFIYLSKFLVKALIFFV